MEAIQRSRLARLLGRAPALRKDATAIVRYADSRRRALTTIARDPAEPPGQRAGACWLLARVGGRGTLGALLAAATDVHPSLRCGALIALGLWRDPRALPTVRRLARRDPDLTVRVLAVHALGELADSASLRFLIRTLDDTRQPVQLRDQAAESLAYIDDRRSVPALIAATRDRSVGVRYSAVYALGALGHGDLRCRAALQRAAASDHARYRGLETVSAQARRALACLDSRVPSGDSRPRRSRRATGTGRPPHRP